MHRVLQASIERSLAPLGMTQTHLQTGVAWEFYVGKKRPPKIKVIGANRQWRQKIVRPGGSNDVVLVDTIATDTDGTDQHAIAIKRKAARENRNTIWKIRNDAVPHWRRPGLGRECDIGLGAAESRDLVLFGEKW